ncbi:MAG: hypothetical protein GX791_01570 [Synergistaceae bacterium]|nr:hypothetical protein [Synergistaceae bacterium]
MITNDFAYATFPFFFAGRVPMLKRKYRDTTFFKYVPASVILPKSAGSCGFRVNAMGWLFVAKVLSVMAGV